ncbi:glycerate kinase [Camelimonas abortus]|uniref:Glycerate kinase n=1 Tax=Camelimonas abortus TaxID=1017184 RepID=A0ABV7LGZ4_9HYPH
MIAAASPLAGPVAFLRQLFEAAVAAADPARVVPAALPDKPAGRVVVAGAGKASAAMAQALERAWRARYGETPEGLVITAYGHAAPCERIIIREAAHPTPDAAGARAAQEMLALLDGLGPDDLVIALISGGGSALAPAPAPGLTLADKQAATRALLASGATISEINTVRKHLSLLKGGRLAARAAPARVAALMISDAPGDDPAVIASGPTVADPTTRRDALAVLDRYAIAAPAARAWLDNPASETIKPGDPRLARAENHIIAAPRLSLQAAAELARARGVTPLVLGDAIEGEAAEAGRVFAGVARFAAGPDAPFGRPCVILSGGETTVTLREPPPAGARGGRNVEFLLSLALHLDGAPGIWALAADTDGVDGAAPVAGATITPDTLARARAIGLDAAASLARHDAHGFFGALGDSLVTGPTRTNVNDFRAILVGPIG